MTQESENKTEDKLLTNGIKEQLEGRTLIENCGFPLEELFNIATKFFKDNQNKAFHPSYDERNHLLALIVQVSQGPFNEKDAPPLGPFDIVGRDRRQAWKEIGSLSPEHAMRDFVLYLDKLCSSFRPYVEAHKREKDDQEQKMREEEERQRLRKLRLDEEEKSRAANKAREEELRRFEEQKFAIQEALNRQTAQQFGAYAQQQYPNNPEQQAILIKQLQEQHYQQYMQQMFQHQLKAQNNKNSQSSTSGTTYPPLLNNENVGLPSYQSTQKANSTSPMNTEQVSAHSEEANGGLLYEDDRPREDEENESSSNEEAEDEDIVPIANAHMWTRKDIKAFKESISKDCGDGIIKVGHGEIVTVRVPTHPDGTFIFWEFATDSYDIGFGLLFEWTKNPGNQVSVHISESEDEDDEEDDEDDDGEAVTPVKAGTLDDAEKGQDADRRSNINDSPPCSVIIPIYRRDSHEEVFAGSHPYPGKGVYLLKFDNSYSLWRSKTLYYRVYYTR